MTRMTYGFLPRPERPLMVPRHSPPLHRQRLRPCHLTKSNTKTWQTLQCFNKTQFWHILETSWNIVNNSEMRGDFCWQTETCWNMLKLSLVVTHARWKCRLSPEASGFRSFQVKVQPESSTHARLRVQVHPVFERQELQFTCVGVLRWRETQTKKN